MNLNCLLLSRIVRKPEVIVEQHWRKSKSFARIEEQKRNYLLAWQGVLKMLSLPCRPVPEVNEVVTVGHLRGTLVRYDEEFAYLSVNTNGDSDVVGVPITLMLMA